MNAFRLAAVVLMLVVAHACVDQSAPYPPNGIGGRDGTGGSHGGGTGGTGGGAGSGGAAGTGGVAGSSGTGGVGGAGGQAGAGGIGGAGGGAIVGACNNETDVAALMALMPTNARQIAAACGISYQNELLNESQFKADVSSCVANGVTGLSPDCANCYGALAFCGGFTCLFPCDVDSCSIDCLTCPGYEACITELTQCAGRPSTDCPGDT